MTKTPFAYHIAYYKKQLEKAADWVSGWTFIILSGIGFGLPVIILFAIAYFVIRKVYG